MRIKLSLPIDIDTLPKNLSTGILSPENTSGMFKLPAANRSDSTPRRRITHISTDSREAISGDLFICLAKDAILASRYISEALAKGAYVLCNSDACINGLTPLETIASYYRDRLPNLKKVIAVTGSNGKTTTKEFTKAILSSKNTVHATNGNMNNEIGLPLVILESNYDTEVLVLEMGMNGKGEIGRLSRVARPDIGAITNVGTAHIGMLGSKKAIAEAKLEIAEGIPPGGILITRSEDQIKSERRNDIIEYTYSCKDKNATSVLSPTSCGGYILNVANTTLPFSFFSNAPHILEDLSLSLSIAYHSGLSFDELSSAIKRINPDILRYTISRIGRITIIDDAYNSSIESARAALALLKDQTCEVRSALLGDILESGEHSERIHFQLGVIAAGTVDKLYLTGDMSNKIKEGAISAGLPENRIFIIPNTDNIRGIAHIVGNLTDEGECLLVKASHRCGLYKFKEEYERLVKNDE